MKKRSDKGLVVTVLATVLILILYAMNVPSVLFFLALFFLVLLVWFAT